MTRGVPKLCGADVELGNFVLGLPPGEQSVVIASQALLREIPGFPDPKYQVAQFALPVASGWGEYATANSWGGSKTARNPQDWGRRYLLNGGCAYIDLDHLELCIPEVRSAYDHVAAWHAMLRIAQRALAAANQRFPEGLTLQALVNNSDGAGHAYGSHLSFLLSRDAYDDIFSRRLQQLLLLASYQCSSIVFTGQGKVGSENNQPAVPFQISQRADFFEALVGEQTTFHRPIVNSRDEALCGPGRNGYARLHCIFYDNTLCHTASLLKVGVMQCILAMIEAGYGGTALLLDAPLDALHAWSHDPTLQTRAATVGGRDLTAVEHQLLLVEDAYRFDAHGGFDNIVPRASDILTLWADTLEKLRAGDLTAVAPRIDWVLKLGVLQRTLDRRTELSWESPELKHLDHLYSSLDPAEGLYWTFEQGGVTEALVTDDEIERRVHEPPPDTRAWTRAKLLERAGASRVEYVDWDSIRFRADPARRRYGDRTFHLPDPLGFTAAETAAAFTDAATLDDILNTLEQ